MSQNPSVNIVNVHLYFDCYHVTNLIRFLIFMGVIFFLLIFTHCVCWSIFRKWSASSGGMQFSSCLKLPEHDQKQWEVHFDPTRETPQALNMDLPGDESLCNSWCGKLSANFHIYFCSRTTLLIKTNTEYLSQVMYFIASLWTALIFVLLLFNSLSLPTEGDWAVFHFIYLDLFGKCFGCA